MSFHHDVNKWLLQAQKEHCPYCLKEDDPTGSVTLKLFEYSELCAHPSVCLKGTCYLIAREHYFTFTSSLATLTIPLRANR